MSRTVLLALTSSILLGGCASLSPAAAKVQVHAQISNFLNNCKKLGPVSSTFTLRPFVDSGPFLQAALREQTANLGGDSLVLLQLDDSMTEATLHGVAFKCY
jgi:hypothetical protein